MLDSVDIATRVAEILDRHRGTEGALLPILHEVQAQFGYVPEEVLPQIAQDQNISKAEAYGVMTFYHDFRSKPAGQHVLKLCRAESCKTMGADQLAAAAREKLGIDWHETTPDGKITLEPIFCLGLCACGPAALVDGKVVGRVDEAKLEQIVKGMR
ncbi:formate dehydrogenase subunit gamma [Pseudogemmobacter faecipullorum]|uniref:Formate dehydrogenase subunit gamma n=1 Tax=Pseudogemmobacter faecipullorum TaxID=2755041 RepID=A0ABS8CH91_9RHOB|nr:formate dehydrogenase subunit gamma [Pseudogemmobacter faecipullorum]MCB5408568.1 formate dehydrogenase subunit gamma [Pseudogemmobacter faecipullorum]